MHCCLLSSRSFVIHFDCCPSHCLCQMQMWHHLAACFLDITLLPYTCRRCQWMSAADTFCAHKKAYNSTDFQTRPVIQVGHCVELLPQCSFCAYMLNHITMSIRVLCRICQQHLSFQRVWYLE